MIEPYKKKSIARLKKARGQIDGIIKMIENDKNETDIITQSLAVQGALKSIALLVLESHLNTAGISHLASQQSRKKDKYIKELIKTWKISFK